MSLWRCLLTAALLAVPSLGLADAQLESGEASTATIQEDAPSDEHGLLLAIRTTLDSHPELALNEQQLAYSIATVEASRSAFDHHLSASLGTDHFFSPMPLHGSESGVTDSLSADFSINGSRATPWGMTVSPWVGVSRTELRGIGEGASLVAGMHTANVGLQVTQSLLQGGGRVGAASSLKAAEIDVDVLGLDLEQAMSLRVLATTQAYWNVLAAREQVLIVKESAARTLTLLEETRLLVEADERPAADLQQIEASLATDRALIVRVESGLVSARLSLGLALGLDEVASLERMLPLEDLPDPEARSAADLADSSSFLATAETNRRDLAALARQVAAAEVRVAGARRNALPSLDLSVSGGYSSLLGGEEAATEAALLGGTSDGFDVGASLSLAWPVENRAKRAALQQALSSQRIAQIRRAETRRAVRSGVVAAVDSLRAALLGLQAAREAVSFYETSVASEVAKLRAGMATVIDVVLTEDRLTTAQRSLVAARLECAQARAMLAYKTGEIPGSLTSLDDSLLGLLVTGSSNGGK
jgi:outer membrane protein TolC